MVTQENALINNELWCVYELKDQNGKYYEDLRLSMRKVSQNNKFICPDCGEHLILCAGNIMEPYFRHHENSRCIIRSNGRSGNYPLARRILFQLAKRSFPEATISCSKKLQEYIADIYIDNDNSKLVFEYVNQDMKLDYWEAKHSFYEQQGIADIWFLNSSKYKKGTTFTTFEYMISTKKKMSIILAPEEEQITLKRRCKILADNSSRTMEKCYSISELTVRTNGNIQCDFDSLCENYINCVNKDITLVKDREEQDSRERITSEKIAQDRRALESTAQERVSQEKAAQERMALEKSNNESEVQERITPDKAPEEIIANKRNIFEQDTKRNNVHESNSQVSNTNASDTEELIKVSIKKGTPQGKVQRRMLTQEQGPLIAQMTAINESWDLPPLQGKVGIISSGGAKRLQYIKELNQRLQRTPDLDKRNRFINHALEQLSDVRAYSWSCWQKG